MEDLDGRTAKRMGPPPAVRTAILKALASNAELQPEPYRDAADEARQSQWRTTSVGDLETIDSMLDQLVVADSRMREALLKGPLISFETVIPEASLTLSSMAQDGEEPDTTFITAVPGQGLEGEGEEEDQRGDLQCMSKPVLISLPCADGNLPLYIYFLSEYEEIYLHILSLTLQWRVLCLQLPGSLPLRRPPARSSRCPSCLSHPDLT
jgi:hypothetical protein